VVDQVDLLYQSQEEISRWLGEPVGVVGDQKYETHRVTVATVQTLKKHIRDPKFLKWYKAVEIVIVDELHVQMSRKNFSILELVSPMARFGLTATLQMTKENVRMNVWAFSGPIIFRFPIREGQDKGVLSEGKVIQLLFPEAEGNKDYQIAYHEEVMESEAKHRAAYLIVKELLSRGRYVLVLVSRIDHVKLMDRLLEEFPHRLAYGEVGKDLRKAGLNDFEKGLVRLLIANVVFEKGINVKRLDAILDMAEMQSKNTAVQKFGRGVRLHTDKKNLVYIEFGTQTGRFLRNARSRARAFRADEIPVKSVKIENPAGAIKAVRRALDALEGSLGPGDGSKSSHEAARGQKTHALDGAKQQKFNFGRGMENET
jgi:superfamily II DNA or RNA helicase